MGRWKVVITPLAAMILGSPLDVLAFAPVVARNSIASGTTRRREALHLSSKNEWSGEVVSNDENGKIRGCSIQPVTPNSITEWTLTIDGVDADLGRFSDAIYKKVIGDAKQQRFQGFRPGTIPPHLQPTYVAYAMDECAREAVLEALQQNNIRPFSEARTDMILDRFEIPPADQKKKSKKSSTNKKDKGAAFIMDEDVEEPKPEPQWRSFETMREAISAGWRPGQSFSFRATNVRGQKVKDQSEVDGATPVMKF